MKLSTEDTKTLEEAAEAISDILRPHAQKKAEGTGKTVYSVVAGLFRPYIRHAEDADYDVPGARRDNRTRTWGIKLYFWDVAQGMANADNLGETDYEEVVGLYGVGEAIREYVADLHDEDDAGADDFPEFSEESLHRKMQQLRPAIWRGGGKATARIYYTLPGGNKGLCQVDLSRA